MTDEQTPDQSSSNPEDHSPLGGFDSADDLDKILAEAASLISDITLEVGESTADRDDDLTALDSNNAGDVAAQLDEELAALEDLVCDTSHELGTSEEETGAEIELTGAFNQAQDTNASIVQPAAESASAGRSTESQNGDDAMASSAPATDSDEQQSAAQTEVKAKTAVEEKDAPASVSIQSPKPGVVGTPMFGTSLEDYEEEEFEEEQPPKPRWVQVFDERISPAALAVCHRSAKILDIIDHRIGHKISEPVKVMIGWAALATLGTAFMTYLISFFWTP